MIIMYGQPPVEPEPYEPYVPSLPVTPLSGGWQVQGEAITADGIIKDIANRIAALRKLVAAVEPMRAELAILERMLAAAEVET